MCDSGYHSEQLRQAKFLQRQCVALERLHIQSKAVGCKLSPPARLGPVQDYPHDKRRDVLGIGAYQDLPATRMTQGEMTAILQTEAMSNANVPQVFMALRRRARVLRDNQMYMGPNNAFADYFPPWASQHSTGKCSSPSEHLGQGHGAGTRGRKAHHGLHEHDDRDDPRHDKEGRLDGLHVSDDDDHDGHGLHDSGDHHVFRRAKVKHGIHICDKPSVGHHRNEDNLDQERRKDHHGYSANFDDHHGFRGPKEKHCVERSRTPSIGRGGREQHRDVDESDDRDDGGYEEYHEFHHSDDHHAFRRAKAKHGIENCRKPSVGHDGNVYNHGLHESDDHHRLRHIKDHHDYRAPDDHHALRGAKEKHDIESCVKPSVGHHGNEYHHELHGRDDDDHRGLKDHHEFHGSDDHHELHGNEYPHELHGRDDHHELHDSDDHHESRGAGGKHNFDGCRKPLIGHHGRDDDDDRNGSDVHGQQRQCHGTTNWKSDFAVLNRHHHKHDGRDHRGAGHLAHRELQSITGCEVKSVWSNRHLNEHDEREHREDHQPGFSRGSSCRSGSGSPTSHRGQEHHLLRGTGTSHGQNGSHNRGNYKRGGHEQKDHHGHHDEDDDVDDDVSHRRQ